MWLRYINGAGTVIPDQVSRKFRELVLLRVPTVKRETGVTLRSINYANLISKHEKYKMTISADELASNDAFAFVEAWWGAELVFVSTSNAGTEPADEAFIEVVLVDGDLPVEFIEGHTRMREVSAELLTKFPVVA